MTTTKPHRLSIFMLPWLAHGHISPFLELAQKLTQRGIFIYFCSTPINLTSIKNQITHFNFPKNIQLIELNLPSSPDLPPHLHTTNGLPSHLAPNLRAAVDAAGPVFARILKDLDPDLLIHDIALRWAADIATSLNIPNLQFLTSSAAFASFFLHMMACPGAGYPFPAIYLREFEFGAILKLLQIPTAGGGGKTKEEEEEVMTLQEIPQGSSPILLIKSLKEIEGKYMDYFSLLNKKTVVSVGPLIRDSSHDDESSDIIEWLDEKHMCSTVFVSFGSEYFLSKEEITEIARGLELSGVNFIWVLRFPKGEKITSAEGALPEDFLEKVRERGRVVEGWAPQGRILGHPSVGGFVSHCGWNSVMESINCGVPIIAMPMQLDQPLNARLMVEIGVGVEITRGNNGKIEREEVGKVVREVVVGKIGVDLRNKARELMDKMKLNGEEEIDGAVEELVKICAKKRNVLSVT